MVVAIVCVRRRLNRDASSSIYAGQERVPGQAGRNADSCQSGTSVQVQREMFTTEVVWCKSMRCNMESREGRLQARKPDCLSFMHDDPR
jgi:hypothetical protein